MGAGPEAVGIIQAAQPDPLVSELFHHGLRRGAFKGEAHQACRRGRLHQGLGPGHCLERVPELLTEGRDGGEALLGAAFGIEQGEGEEGAFYWTVLAPDIVNPGREERVSIQL